MSEELKPCPCCGADAEALEFPCHGVNDQGGAVHCTECCLTSENYGLAGKPHSGLDYATMHWNRRADSGGMSNDYLLRDLELFLIESRDCIGCPSGPGCLDGSYDGKCGVNERRERLLRRIQGEPNRRADSGWVAVSERLPDDGQRVIVHTSEGQTECTWCVKCSDGNHGWDPLGDTMTDGEHVTHWRPIPPQPEAE